MSKNINVPKLRFSEFSGEWEEKKLDDIAKFSKGKGISKSDIVEDGNLECIRYGELYTKYKETIIDIYSKTNLDKKDLILSEYGDVIIPASGETQIDIATASCVLKDNVALSGDLNIIKTKENGVFLSYYLNNRKKLDIAKLSQGISVVHLYSSQLKLLKLKLPSKSEQEKIASFLTSVDTKIEQLTKKETLLQEYKKGVMSKIFNQEIRFKDDDGSEFPEWEDSLLGDVLDYIQPTKYLVKDTEYDNSYNTPVLTAGKTFILGYTNETDGIFENNLPVIIFDDFTTANKFVDFPFKAKSSAMKILIPKNNNNIKFIYETMQMIKYEVGGHERHWISKFTFLNIFMPCIKEQTKIANFLSSIDKKIELTTKELNSTKEFKKALLQQMFV